VIFDFVNYYLYKNPIHPTLDSIQVSDALYAEFCAFTQDKEIEYETETYKAVKDLIKTAKDEKYYDLVTNELTNLEKLLALDKNNDLKIFEKELRQLIREELSVRLYYNSGLIHTTISVDKQVAAAKKILINQKTYEEVFVPLHENTTSN